MLLGAHDLAGANVLDGLSIGIDQTLFLSALCFCLRNHLSGDFAGALLCAVAALDVFTAHLHLAQGAFHLAHCGFQRCVEGVFLSLCTGDVALAGRGDLDAVGLCFAAWVRLVLQLHVEEGQCGIKAFNLCQLVVDALLEVFRYINVTARNRYLSFVWLGH